MRTICLSLLCLLVASVSCTEDGVSRNPPSLDPGMLPDGGGVNPDPHEGCPDTQPKVGENCTPGITESNQCDFVLGECVAGNGMTYVETITFCCKTGVWEACGGRSPCDNMPAVDAAEPTPEVDAGAPDASADASDASPDGQPDAGTD
jgi:hypothetical protein